MSEKARLDQYLVDAGLAPSRNIAKGYILAGEVYINDQRSDKAGLRVRDEDLVEVRSKSPKYVSRGGLKLEGALDTFGFDPAGLCCLDVGASTGGFTDCLLQRGARRVVAIDVGYGQLQQRLRNDERVVVRERVNFRYFDARELDEPCHAAVSDVSFISLKLILPVMATCLAAGAWVVVLVKPQFEVGREDVGKGGIVRSEAAQLRALADIEQCAAELGFAHVGSCESPIQGAKGNREWLLALRWPGAM